MAVKIGDTFRSSYADGNPLWKVVRRSGKSAVIAVSQAEMYVLPNGQEIEGDYAGIEQAFTVKQVESAKRWASTLSRLGNEHDEFFASLKVGQVLHYHNGFGQYVRCEVVVGEGLTRHGDDLTGQLVLQPVALVGEWERDLPKRDAQGNVRLGHFGEMIVNREGAWQPSTSCIFEAPGFSGPRGPVAGRDPREMEAIDLSVPELDEAGERAAAAERMRAAMIEILNDYRLDDAEAAINAAVKLALGVSS